MIRAGQLGSCESIKDELIPADCELNLKIKKEGAQSCEDGADKDQCYMAAAVILKDASHCEKISNKELKTSCGFVISKISS